MPVQTPSPYRPPPPPLPSQQVPPQILVPLMAAVAVLGESAYRRGKRTYGGQVA
ncbi:hypothetical protein OG762_03765 [Streptomyces sp. NBC_01136]|uniref:hypothetical protein n=1 Tax=Streptomyces sp. NBC_01136 TaxID=2903754 RepID=UPI0038665CA5|nr:hypothetical protein OG762_03765 [Streptomyces sp. NBC_01136]